MSARRWSPTRPALHGVDCSILIDAADPSVRILVLGPVESVLAGGDGEPAAVAFARSVHVLVDDLLASGGLHAVIGLDGSAVRVLQADPRWADVPVAHFWGPATALGRDAGSSAPVHVDAWDERYEDARAAVAEETEAWIAELVAYRRTTTERIGRLPSDRRLVGKQTAERAAAAVDGLRDSDLGGPSLRALVTAALPVAAVHGASRGDLVVDDGSITVVGPDLTNPDAVWMNPGRVATDLKVQLSRRRVRERDEDDDDRGHDPFGPQFAYLPPNGTPQSNQVDARLEAYRREAIRHIDAVRWVGSRFVRDTVDLMRTIRVGAGLGVAVADGTRLWVMAPGDEVPDLRRRLAPTIESLEGRPNYLPFRRGRLGEERD